MLDYESYKFQIIIHIDLRLFLNPHRESMFLKVREVIDLKVTRCKLSRTACFDSSPSLLETREVKACLETS